MNLGNLQEIKLWRNTNGDIYYIASSGRFEQFVLPRPYKYKQAFFNISQSSKNKPEVVFIVNSIGEIKTEYIDAGVFNLKSEGLFGDGAKISIVKMDRDLSSESFFKHIDENTIEVRSYNRHSENELNGLLDASVIITLSC
jgi:hypothetical protein